MSFHDQPALQAAFKQQVRWCERHDAPFMARLMHSAGLKVVAQVLGREGCDLAPLQLAVAAQQRKLLTCIWPHGTWVEWA